MFIVKNNLDLQQSSSSLIIGLFQDTEQFSGSLKQLDDSFDGHISELITSNKITLKAKEITPIFTFNKIGAKQLYIVGLGKKEQYSTELLREIFGRTFKSIKKANLNDVALYLDSFTTEEVNNVQAAQLMSEAMMLSTYELVTYKESKQEDSKTSISQIIVYSEKESEDDILKALKTGFTYGKAVNSARSLVNLPGNMLTATEMANYAEQLAKKYNFEIEILDRTEMEQLGMGALLAVNNGSVEPPKMIVLKHCGKEEWTDVIGLVGKGVTFDTGGYSIKPKDGIVGMKSDMGGAAAVLGAMEIIGELQLAQNVLAVIPATDNMISGKALKPDDVIVSLSGKTIEVLNTDAEGRLVLADAVTYAKQQGADYLIDAATLTGGVIVALGTEITGALTNSEALYSQVEAASQNTGELIWQFPLIEKDKKRVRDSKIADLNNSPGREGHAIMGGAFIGEFAEETPWVHLDIAGTATTKADHDLGDSGATGVMTRTLALLVEQFKPF